mmetsp:Transcript_13470/g.31701  ORF Transcript_13470/g.31701 Transcript_13470/m.31701 type:complete len:98 (-) Transcript_13470:468-761(-)
MPSSKATTQRNKQKAVPQHNICGDTSSIHVDVEVNYKSHAVVKQIKQKKMPMSPSNRRWNQPNESPSEPNQPSDIMPSHLNKSNAVAFEHRNVGTTR